MVLRKTLEVRRRFQAQTTRWKSSFLPPRRTSIRSGLPRGARCESSLRRRSSTETLPPNRLIGIETREPMSCLRGSERTCLYPRFQAQATNADVLVRCQVHDCFVHFGCIHRVGLEEHPEQFRYDVQPVPDCPLLCTVSSLLSFVVYPLIITTLIPSSEPVYLPFDLWDHSCICCSDSWGTKPSIPRLSITAVLLLLPLLFSPSNSSMYLYPTLYATPLLLVLATLHTRALGQTEICLLLSHTTFCTLYRSLFRSSGYPSLFSSFALVCFVSCTMLAMQEGFLTCNIDGSRRGHINLVVIRV